MVEGGQSINALPNFLRRSINAPLFVEDLLAAGTAETGLQDYGDRRFIDGLTVFADALRSEAQLNQTGQMIVAADIVRMLSNRLRFQRDVSLHPEIRDEQIVGPIVIVGLPRTGTSKLQRMISADPAVQRLDVWRLLNPAPFPGERVGSPQSRILAALVVERTLATRFPDSMARHPIEALEPDEEVMLMEPSFECVVSTFRFRTPSPRRYIDSRDPRTAYEYMRSMLQYLQWQDGGGRGRPWIMKSPIHIGSIETLFELFPDATVVHCHRDPRKVIPSFSSLVEASRRIASDDVDLAELGGDMLEYWAVAIDRNLAAREQIDVSQIVDVPYDQIRDDAVGVIAKVYERAGCALAAEAETRMLAYESRRPENHWGRHQYDAERFGLTDEQIDARFAAYRERFRELSLSA
jgi:Sulfotransferase family